MLYWWTLLIQKTTHGGGAYGCKNVDRGPEGCRENSLKITKKVWQTVQTGDSLDVSSSTEAWQRGQSSSMSKWACRKLGHRIRPSQTRIHKIYSVQLTTGSWPHQVVTSQSQLVWRHQGTASINITEVSPGNELLCYSASFCSLWLSASRLLIILWQNWFIHF